MQTGYRLFCRYFLAIALLYAPLNTAIADDFDDDFDLMEEEKPQKELPATTDTTPPVSAPAKSAAPTPEPTTVEEEEKDTLSFFSKLFSSKEDEEKKKKAATMRKIPIKEKPTAKARAANVDLLTKVRKGLPFATEEIENWILNTQDINTCYENGQTMLLYVVARYADTEALRLLIDNGADLQTHCTPRYEALFIAAINNPSAAVMDMLATNGANIVERDTEKNTALILAATFNRASAVVTTLLDYGLKPDTVNRYGYNALMLAAYENGRIPIVQALLDNGAEIDAKDPEGHTPLMAAAIRGRDEVMQYLIRRGADFKAVDKEGISVLDYYNKRYYLTTLNFDISAIATPSERLSKQFKFIAEKHFYYNDALRKAPYSNNPNEATADAIKNLADIDILDENGCTPFLNAVRQNNPLEVLQQYIDAKADINAVCLDNQNALMFLAPHTAPNASPEEALGKLKYLIRNNINLDTTDSNGYSALMYALNHHANAHYISILLKAGADVNISSHDGETPLWLALRNQNAAETLKVLIEYGADVNQKDARRETPLWYQLRTNGNPDLTMLLIKNSADTEIKSPTNETPLWYALHHHLPSIVTDALIEVEKHINDKDDDEDTPLLFAVKNNYPPETIKLLLNNGADPNIEDKNGFTMYDVLQNSRFFNEAIKKKNREEALGRYN